MSIEKLEACPDCKAPLRDAGYDLQHCGACGWDRLAGLVRAMLSRGYALLVEVEQPDGTKAFQRAHDFDEKTAEYIVADFDSSYAALPPTAPARGKPRGTKRVPASSTRAIAAASSAGG